MRVLHVSGPSTGGIGVHIRQLHQGMAPMGVDSNWASPVKMRPESVVNTALELKGTLFILAI